MWMSNDEAKQDAYMSVKKSLYRIAKTNRRKIEDLNALTWVRDLTVEENKQYAILTHKMRYLDKLLDELRRIE